MSAPPFRISAAIAILVALACAVSVAGQDTNPDRERGFKADSVYQFNGFDNVNLFNGSLNLAIPLVSYPVSSDVSYSFALYYSNNVWEYTWEPKFPGPGEEPQLKWWSRWEGAGFGWRLNFGTLESVASGVDAGRPGTYRYTAPDGSTHLFYETLHDPVCSATVNTNCDPKTAGVWYSRDGSYLRLKLLADGARVVEFPDGRRHRFNAGMIQVGYYYGLSSTLDAAGVPTTNWVKFEYPQPVLTGNPYLGVIVTDSVGRRHEIDHVNGTNDFWRIDKIRLAAPRSAAEESADTPVYAMWDLVYDAATGTTDGAMAQILQPFTDGTLVWQNMRFLRRIILPTGETWEFAYDPATTQSALLDTGMIEKAILPTGGRIRWSWQMFSMVGGGGLYGKSTGVKERCFRADDQPCSMTAAAGTQEQYQIYSNADSKTTVATYELSGSTWAKTAETVSYFVTAAGNEFGLPVETGTTGWRRSTEFSSCIGSTCTLQRSERLKYEMDSTSDCNIDYPCHRERNRRVLGRRTVFSSDGGRTVDTAYGNFDGLGHYRESETTSTFTISDGTARSYTGYNTTSRNLAYNPSVPSTWVGSSVGTYSLSAAGDRAGDMVMLQVSDPWFLNNYTDMWTSDDRIPSPSNPAAARKYYSEACFDPGKGFLYRKRTRAGESRGATDVITARTRDSATGFASREETFGGDGQTLDASASVSLCTITLSHTSGTYRVDHTYEHGVRKSSRFYDVGRAQTMPYSIDHADIDKNTGLVRSTRDASGLATAFSYDTVQRLTQIAPPGVSATNYTYVAATSSAEARVEATTGAGDLQQATTWEFDRFGRVSLEKQKMPNGTWSGRQTLFDSVGRRASVSEQMLDSSQFQNKTSYLNYDMFGRVGTIQAPDGKATTFTYTGARLTRRNYEVATSTGARTVSVDEEFDRDGRLIAVTEDAAGSPVRTEYTYDPAGRLIKVHWPTGVAGQDRTFAYDGRGFLMSETHPESGVTSYLYDALGKVTERTTATNTVSSTYDRAGRLTVLQDSVAGELKRLAYDRTNSGSDYAMGKIDYGIRHNRSTDFGDVVVKETYFYAGPGGRMSRKVTEVQRSTPTAETFSLEDAYVYDTLGNLLSVSYPKCVAGASGCVAFAPPARTIASAYKHGRVIGVPPYTQSWIEGLAYRDGITYHPNGLIKNINVNPGVLYTQAVAANGMGRPESITVTNYCDSTDLAITSHPQSKTVTSGSSAGLSVAATGSVPLGYAWYQVLNGAAYLVPGQSGSTLTLTVTQTATFFARVSMGGCSLDSERAVVTVQACTPPTATITAPSSVVTTAEMTAFVAAEPGSTYQWTVTNGTIVSGAGTSSILFLPSSCATTIELSVTVTNSSGCSASGQRTVTRSLSATLTGTTTIDVGQSTNLTLTLGGAAPWTVNWSDGVQETAASSPFVRSVTPSATTTYTATVTDGFGCAMTVSGNAVVTVRPAMPQNVNATATSSTQVSISWTYAVPGTTFKVYRENTYIGQTTATAYGDIPGGSGTAIVYKVTAVVGGTESLPAEDVAAMFAFTDYPLVAQSTLIRAAHVTVLQNAINAVRARAVLGAVAFPSIIPNVTIVQASHVQGLLDPLDDARQVLGLPRLFDSTTVTAGSPIRANLLNAIREAL